MLIRIGFDIALNVTAPISVIYLLRVHPSRQEDLQMEENFRTVPALPREEYIDSHGNHCGRINVPEGCSNLQFLNEAIIHDEGTLDEYAPFAQQLEVAGLPVETLSFLLSSRYCEVDSELLPFAWDRFHSTPPGWARVQAICDFVHQHIRFNYALARPNRSALEAFRERVGVCRDFAHLAITLSRCMNIPARYVTGYLPDINVPVAPGPMDFSAWFEVYLGDRWYTFDARHNQPRVGRIVVARGRDAVDVPITMAFGGHTLSKFTVIGEEIDAGGIIQGYNSGASSTQLPSMSPQAPGQPEAGNPGRAGRADQAVGNGRGDRARAEATFGER